MTWARKFAIGTLLATACLASAARADALDDYMAVRIAQNLNLVCHALKFVEASYLPGISLDYLGQTDQGLAYRNDLIDTVEFGEWQNGIDAEARSRAEEIGCSEAATTYLLAARAMASQKIYQGLLLAFHFGSDRAPDKFRQPLTEFERQVAGSYDGFLQQVYGANYAEFATQQRQAAAQRLPQTAYADTGAAASEWGEVGLEMLLGQIQSADDIDMISSAQSAARWAIDHVALEVFAETNGWAVWPIETADGALYPALQRPDGDTAPMPLWSGVHRYDLGGDRGFWYAIARLPDGRLRLMTFGDQAVELNTTSTIRLYIPDALPEGWSGYGFFEQPQFREVARIFEAAEVADEPCLGGPCFDFDLAAAQAALSYGENNVIELFIAPQPGIDPAPTSDLSVEREQVAVSGLARIAGGGGV